MQLVPCLLLRRPVFVSLLLSAILDSFCDVQEQLNDSLLVIIEEKGSVFSTWVSFSEMYNENLYELLAPIGSGRQTRQTLELGEDKVAKFIQKVGI
jgi:hypothetical protein